MYLPTVAILEGSCNISVCPYNRQKPTRGNVQSESPISALESSRRAGYIAPSNNGSPTCSGVVFRSLAKIQAANYELRERKVKYRKVVLVFAMTFDNANPE